MDSIVGTLSTKAIIFAGLEMVELVRKNLPDNTAANLLADQVDERANELKLILEAPTEQDLYMKELEEAQDRRDNAYRAIVMILQAHKLCPEDPTSQQAADRILHQLHPFDFLAGALLHDSSVLCHRLLWLQEEEQMTFVSRFHLLPFVERLGQEQGRFDALLEKRVTARESRGVSILRAIRPLERSLQTLLAFVRETCEPHCFQRLQAPLVEARQMSVASQEAPALPS